MDIEIGGLVIRRVGPLTSAARPAIPNGANPAAWDNLQAQLAFLESWPLGARSSQFA